MLRVGGIWRDLPAARVVPVLEQVVGAVPGLAPAVRALLTTRLRSAGGISWAPVGGGFALPHFRDRVSLGREAGVLALLLLREESPLVPPGGDGVPVTRLFFFVPPSPRAHLDVLGRLSRALTDGPLRTLLERGAPDETIREALAAADASRGGAS